MKIAIDCSKAVNESAGIARYTYEIATGLQKVIKPSDELFYYFNFLRGKHKKELVKKITQDKIKHKIIPLPGALKELIYPSNISFTNLFLGDCDIVHATEFLSFDVGLKVPQVLTVHDLTMAKFPSHKGQKQAQRHTNMLRKACQHADAIISISQATKNDIVEYFHIAPKKIQTIPLGCSKIFKKILDKRKISQYLKKFQISDPYILFVGTIEPRKNVENIIKAFEEISKNEIGSDYTLVLAGKIGWNSEKILKTYNKSEIKDRIKFIHGATDEDLLYLYNGATLFCFPSIYEGFGLPVLEAQKCGVPVVTSDVSSLPEVAGNAALYVDPGNYKDIADKINTVIQNEKIMKQMQWESLKQANEFSWDKCVKQTLEVYKRVLSNEK